MPPMPFEYEGRDVVARFSAALFGAGRRFDLVPTRANGQPAFGAYLRTRAGISHGTGLYVLTLTGDRICAMTRFGNGVLPWFGLPGHSQAASQGIGQVPAYTARCWPVRVERAATRSAGVPSKTTRPPS
jgi:hypothetical protein